MDFVSTVIQAEEYVNLVYHKILFENSLAAKSVSDWNRIPTNRRL